MDSELEMRVTVELLKPDGTVVAETVCLSSYPDIDAGFQGDVEQAIDEIESPPPPVRYVVKARSESAVYYVLTKTGGWYGPGHNADRHPVATFDNMGQASEAMKKAVAVAYWTVVSAWVEDYNEDDD
jgi:hypothetical protein